MRPASFLNRAFSKRVAVSCDDVRLAEFPDLCPEELRSLVPFGFNPSWASKSDFSVIAIRVSNTDTVIVQSQVPQLIGGSRTWKPEKHVMIQSIGTRRGEQPIRDLKFFHFDEAIWCTFNTGHPKSIQSRNDIFLGSLDSLYEGQSYRAVLPNRQRVEKNWGFFDHGGELHAIYSVDPFRVLVATHIDNVKGEIHFSEKALSQNPKIVVPNRKNKSVLNLGSQPVVDGDQIHLAVNEKPYKLMKFRPYFPRILSLEFDLKNIGFPKIGPALFHSEANLSSESQINPYAFGVTYASGLELVDGEMVLGYGIADREYRMVGVEKPEELSRRLPL